MLAPEPTDAPIQFIDGRDLARWILSVPPDGDAASPPVPFGEFLETIVRVANPAARLVWIDGERAKLTRWRDLPFSGVPPLSVAGGPRRDAARADIADTLAWVARRRRPSCLSAPG